MSDTPEEDDVITARYYGIRPETVMRLRLAKAAFDRECRAAEVQMRKKIQEEDY